MTLGQEFADLLSELATDAGNFGSLLRWRHITRTEDPESGAVTTETDEVTFLGIVAEPVRLRMFSDATLQRSASAVVIPAAQLAVAPKLLDECQVQPNEWLVVVEVRQLLGPGDAGSPVLIGYVAALGT